jgi:TonB-dependent SusC/RagA subfamily outer membrane receptor
MEVTVRSFGSEEGDGKAVFISDDGGKPLLILDGVEKPDMKLENIDTDEIEKIEVLKGDRATEKYGSKAKDGVIMITTKK